MEVPKFDELFPSKKDLITISKIKYKAYCAAYDLLVEMFNRKIKTVDGDKFLQIATSESLTAGSIMSILVDIPWGGFLKYGCFGVYDTDAKRVFNGVKTRDVYTHKCAGEMAVGVLKNSNATIALSVTGNAMPFNEKADMVGEIFIGIACYHQDKIIYITKSINSCLDTSIIDFKKKCKLWHTIAKNKTYNKRSDTATISQEIRYYTAYYALKLCKEFIIKYKPCIPDKIITRKKQNEISVPDDKYKDFAKGLCVSDYCDNTGIRNEDNINLYTVKKSKTFKKSKTLKKSKTFKKSKSKSKTLKKLKD